MRLISWNILQGGGNRIPSIIRALVSREPDVIALQEVTERTAPIIAEALRDIRYSDSIDSFQRVKEQKLKIELRYGQLIASRYAIHPLPSDFSIPYSQAVLSGVLETLGGKVEIHNAHVPNGSSYGWQKIETFEGIFSRLACSSEMPRVLCGDFNSPQKEYADGTVVTFGQTISNDGRVVVCRNMLGQNGARWDQGERSVIEGLAEYDLVDVYRLLHGYSKTDFSHWIQRSADKGVRFDHIFCSRALNPIRCEYLHEFREERLSDHSPIEVTFNLRGSQAE